MEIADSAELGPVDLNEGETAGVISLCSRSGFTMNRNVQIGLPSSCRPASPTAVAFSPMPLIQAALLQNVKALVQVFTCGGSGVFQRRLQSEATLDTQNFQRQRISNAYQSLKSTLQGLIF